MTYKISLTWSRVVLSSLLTALLVWPPGVFAWTEPAVAFSGQATVLRVTTHGITTTTTTVSDTGPLPPSGGALQTSLLSTRFPASLTAPVTALPVIVPDVLGVAGADVVVSSSHADVTCQGVPACVGKDFVTGGGFITGTQSGAKGNFGVGGGIKDDGTLWGHLEYIDHGSNDPKVHGTGVTNYSILSANTRQIDGTAEGNGQSCFTYSVMETEHDPPGAHGAF